MNIAITGAGGGIGSILWQRLRSERHNLFHVSTKEGVGRYSYTDLNRLINNGMLDVIIHLAWSSVPADEAGDIAITGMDDVELMKGIVQCLKDASREGVSKPLLVFSSSCAVYGEGDGETVFSEGDETSPISRYGRRKKVVEKVIEDAVDDFGLRSLVLRLTNPYGFMRGDDRPQGVISHLVDALVKEKTFTIWGDGSASKDFVHIDDVTRAICMLVECQGIGTYNLGSGYSVSIDELIAIVENFLERRLATKFTESPPWDVTAGKYSIEKVTKTFGWSPQISLEDGIAQYCKES